MLLGLGLLLAEELLVAQAFAAQDILVFLSHQKHLLTQKLLLVAEVDRMLMMVVVALVVEQAVVTPGKMAQDTLIHTAKVVRSLPGVLVG
jgi:hypothetical protein